MRTDLAPKLNDKRSAEERHSIKASRCDDPRPSRQPDSVHENTIVGRGFDQPDGHDPGVASNVQNQSRQSFKKYQNVGSCGNAFAGAFGLSEEALVRLEAGLRAQREQQLARPVQPTAAPEICPSDNKGVHQQSDKGSLPPTPTRAAFCTQDSSQHLPRAARLHPVPGLSGLDNEGLIQPPDTANFQPPSQRAPDKALEANHPDLHSDAPVRLNGTVHAHDILRDVEQRAAYDGWLEFEREQLGPKSKRTIFDTVRQARSNAIAVVVLAIVLGGGYALFAHLSKAYVESVKVADITAREPAKIAAVQPAARTAKIERAEPPDKTGRAVRQGTIAPTDASKRGDAPIIAKDGPAPSLSERGVDVAKVIEDSGVSTDQADAKTSTDQLKKSDGIERHDRNQNQNMARSVGIELSPLEIDKSIPKSPSSDSMNIRSMKTANLTAQGKLRTDSTKAIECQTSQVGRGYWAWRLVDGRKCWYEGAVGMDKSLLHWPAAAEDGRSPR